MADLNEVAQSPALGLGLSLVAILLNAYICGVVSQQQYSYWTSGFKDPIYVRVFVVVQFAIVLFQSVLAWDLAWDVYIASSIEDYGHIIGPKSETWQGPLNGACQCLLIIMANGFLATRIYALTRSRLQSGLVFGLSVSAFIAGITTITIIRAIGTNLEQWTVSQRVLSGLWHGLQAVAECLIMYFLSRALLKSRSGTQKSDYMVNHLVRNVIQIGLFATLWAIAGLVTWFFEPGLSAYSIIDMSSGSIYTHMVFDGLLSRKRLRGDLNEPSLVDLPVGFSSQPVSEGKRSSRVPGPQVAVSRVTLTDLRMSIHNASSSSGVSKEPESVPVGKLPAGA